MTRKARRGSKGKGKRRASKDLERRSKKDCHSEEPKKESREGRKHEEDSHDTSASVPATEDQVMNFQSAMKYGLNEVVPVMVQLESLHDEYEAEV